MGKGDVSATILESVEFVPMEINASDEKNILNSRPFILKVQYSGFTAPLIPTLVL